MQGCRSNISNFEGANKRQQFRVMAPWGSLEGSLNYSENLSVGRYDKGVGDNSYQLKERFGWLYGPSFV